jgi:hypothetical protein
LKEAAAVEGDGGDEEGAGGGGSRGFRHADSIGAPFGAALFGPRERGFDGERGGEYRRAEEGSMARKRDR